MEENIVTLKWAGSQRYPAETIKGADYVDDLEVLVTSPS